MSRTIQTCSRAALLTEESEITIKNHCIATLNMLASHRHTPEISISQFRGFSTRRPPTIPDQQNLPTAHIEEAFGDAGGDNPGDDSPSNDNPDENGPDEDNADDEDANPFANLPEEQDPTTIVFGNLASTIDRLACSARSSDSLSSWTKTWEPDTFDQTNLKKLHTFLVLCELNFQDQPKAFQLDQAKVTFVQLYLRGMALEWFKPDLLGSGDPDSCPYWMDDWQEFIRELQTTFGPHDPVANAEHQLNHLRMKDTHRVN